MDLSIIIVSWNVRDHLRRCLASIRLHTQGIDYEVIVVDNASQDGSVDMVQSEFPWVHVLAESKNHGFGKANNLGATHASGSVLCFLNDDILLTENSLRILFEKMNADATIGVLGCRMFNVDGSHQDSVRRYPRLSDQLIILTKLHNFFPRLAPIQHYHAADTNYAVEQEVDQVMGAAFMIRSDVFNAVGGFDEQFFVWFEEVDLQKRIREEHGLRILYSPCTGMVHVKGASFWQVSRVTSQRRFQRSQRRYFLKHKGMVAAMMLCLLQPFGIVIALAADVVSYCGGNLQRLKHGQN